VILCDAHFLEVYKLAVYLLRDERGKKKNETAIDHSFVPSLPPNQSGVIIHGNEILMEAKTI